MGLVLICIIRIPNSHYSGKVIQTHYFSFLVVSYTWNFFEILHQMWRQIHRRKSLTKYCICSLCAVPSQTHESGFHFSWFSRVWLEFSPYTRGGVLVDRVLRKLERTAAARTRELTSITWDLGTPANTTLHVIKKHGGWSFGVEGTLEVISPLLYS